ncbi:hypothetical protein KFL_005260060 [Klebsormidium nitens]|uniref:Uncharacterized protein n=1 Tax=Klebsormidium nitens TaxID=105231 RepID=A0A1Y1IL31_KLENI|nr:hypothetical protein KFL_005260060 [Klebsormidium nitens]|eukprot:GAQ89466.1 hypothetical protein KFL_005260060 [Klebsormidium nitens]
MHRGIFSRCRPLPPALFLLVSLAFAGAQVALPQEANERTLQTDARTSLLKDTSKALVSVSDALFPLFPTAPSVEPCNSSLAQIEQALHAYGLPHAYGGRRRLISDVLRQAEFGNLTTNTSEAPPLISGRYFVDGVWGYIMGVIWLILGAFFLCLWGSCKLLKKMPRWIKNMVLGKEEPTIPSTLALAIFNALTFLALFAAIVGVGLAYGANPKTFTTYHQFDRRARQLLDKTANETANAASAFNNASAVFATLPPQARFQYSRNEHFSI